MLLAHRKPDENLPQVVQLLCLGNKLERQASRKGEKKRFFPIDTPEKQKKKVKNIHKGTNTLMWETTAKKGRGTEGGEPSVAPKNPRWGANWETQKCILGAKKKVKRHKILKEREEHSVRPRKHGAYSKGHGGERNAIP